MKCRPTNHLTILTLLTILLQSHICLRSVLLLSYHSLTLLFQTSSLLQRINKLSSYNNLITVLELSYNYLVSIFPLRYNCLLAKVSGNCLLIVFRSSLLDLSRKYHIIVLWLFGLGFLAINLIIFYKFLGTEINLIVAKRLTKFLRLFTCSGCCIPWCCRFLFLYQCFTINDTDITHIHGISMSMLDSLMW